jgi:hypothetical protein
MIAEAATVQRHTYVADTVCSLAAFNPRATRGSPLTGATGGLPTRPTKHPRGAPSSRGEVPPDRNRSGRRVYAGGNLAWDAKV